jgi:protein-tyrosine kinase
MESIREAVERAKTRREQLASNDFEIPRQHLRQNFKSTSENVELDLAHLQSQRIVAHDGKDPHSRPFDILRTEILRSMDLRGWKVLGITSPTPNCGKTFIAANLALSMGRQSESQVGLVDLDLRKPRVAACLGLKPHGEGAIGVLKGGNSVLNELIGVRAGGSKLEVLPTMPTVDSSDLVDSSGMKDFLRDLRDLRQFRIIILDLPPLLTGHDVISILPQIDCILLVAAMGTSKIAEIKECNKYLRSTDVVRFILNKAPPSKADYYQYY